MTAERNRRAMEQLAKQEGNNRCAECRRENPDWVAIVQNLNLGVFVCTDCCGSHRAPGRAYVRTKSIQLDKFDDDEVQLMMASGNRKSNAILEEHYHPCFKRPSSERCPRVLRDQWVIAKYQRHEFKGGSPQPSYLIGRKSGDLFKREKNRNEWNKRFFELSESDNTLRYYVRKSESPKETLLLSEINAVLIEDTLEVPNGMHLMYYNARDDRTRHYYVKAATGQEIIEWYVAIRHARAMRLNLYGTERDEYKLSIRMSRDFIRTGHLWKTGPKDNRFQKRWFVLDQKLLYYFEHPLDAYALNEVVLGHTSEGYQIDEGTTVKTTKAYTMSLTVPSTPNSSGRVYPLAADDDQQWIAWLNAFRKVMAWLPGEDDTGPIQNGSITHRGDASPVPYSPSALVVASAHPFTDRDLPPVPPPRPELFVAAEKNPSPIPSPRPVHTLPHRVGGVGLSLPRSGRYAQDY